MRKLTRGHRAGLVHLAFMLLLARYWRKGAGEITRAEGESTLTD